MMLECSEYFFSVCCWRQCR